MGGRDIRERLLKNDIRILINNLREVSDEVLTLRAFISNKFGEEYNLFLQKTNTTKGVSSLENLIQKYYQYEEKSSTLDDTEDTIIDSISQKSNLECDISVSKKHKKKKRKKHELDNQSELQTEEENEAKRSPSRKKTKNLSSEFLDSEIDSESPAVSPIKKKKKKKRNPDVKSVNSTEANVEEEDMSIFDTPRKCEVCNEKVKPTLTAMKKHIKTHANYETDQKQMCRSCYRVYKYLRRFEAHVKNKKKCKEEMKKRLQNKIRLNGFSRECRFCGKVYRDNARRIDHERTHTGETPYGCDELECGATFTTARNLRRHKLVKHTNNGEATKFQCKLCEFNTARSDYFKEHLKKIHVQASSQLWQFYSTKVLDEVAQIDISENVE